MHTQTNPADVLARPSHSSGLEQQQQPEAMPRNEVESAPKEEGETNGTDGPQKQLAAVEERYFRLAADFENFKKRTAQEMERRAAVQKDALVRDLLPVIDNLERAVVNIASASEKQMFDGIKITWRQLIQLLRQHGFETREDLGQPFNPKYHDAVSTRAETAHGDQTILEVWERGWVRRAESFRPAKVVVNVLDGVSNVRLGTINE